MRIFESSRPDIVIEDCSITDFALRHAERLGEKAAFVDSTNGRSMSYAALADRIRRLAGGLKAQGAGPGTTWALMGPNGPEYAVAFHGLAYAGATVTTLNPTYGAVEIGHQLRDSKATALITSQAFLATAREAAKACGIEHVYLLDDGDAPPLSSLEGEPLAEQVALCGREHGSRPLPPRGVPPRQDRPLARGCSFNPGDDRDSDRRCGTRRSIRAPP